MRSHIATLSPLYQPETTTLHVQPQAFLRHMPVLFCVFPLQLEDISLIWKEDI